MSQATVQMPLDELDAIRSLRDDALDVLADVASTPMPDGTHKCPSCAATTSSGRVYHESLCKIQSVLRRGNRV